MGGVSSSFFCLFLHFIIIITVYYIIFYIISVDIAGLRASKANPWPVSSASSGKHISAGDAEGQYSVIVVSYCVPK